MADETRREGKRWQSQVSFKKEKEKKDFDLNIITSLLQVFSHVFNAQSWLHQKSAEIVTIEK